MADPHSDHQRLLDQVLARAAEDEVFRRRLLDDPGRALHETFGVTLPAGYRIRFVEKPRDVDALIVLPDLRDRDELDDEDLEKAAGGDGSGDGGDDEPW